MNLKLVFYITGIVLIIFALVLLIPLGVSLKYADEGNIFKENESKSFINSMILTFLVGLCLNIIFRASRYDTLNIRDGIMIVFLVWAVTGLFGSLPFFISGAIPSFSDAYFETISGLSTTGASILTRVESLPHGLLFWRSFLHFIGGMGIIVLALTIFPALGIGGYHLFKLESSGDSTGIKLKPRFFQVARTLWAVYLLLNLVLIFLLLIGGMPLFDACCHAFATIATGGFSTKTASLADPQINSVFISYVIIIFMFLSACSFRLHYSVLKGNFREIVNDSQLKVFFSVIVVAVIIVILSLLPVRLGQKSFEGIFREACFQVVSIGSCTGFTSTDINKWPDLGKFILLILMLIGGCAGSTTGAIKQIRIIMLAKMAWRELIILVRPNQVITLKMNGVPIDRAILKNVVAFFLLYITTIVIAAIILTAMGLDIISAGSAVVSAMGGVGPGLGSVSVDYSTVPVLGKWVLSLCMLVGRLEIFGIWAIFSSSTWKR